MSYEFGGEPPDQGKLIRDPPTHIRLAITEASAALRRHQFAQAFEGVNEAMLIFDEENRISRRTTTGKALNELIDTWKKWYVGPTEETV